MKVFDINILNKKLKEDKEGYLALEYILNIVKENQISKDNLLPDKKDIEKIIEYFKKLGFNIGKDGVFDKFAIENILIDKAIEDDEKDQLENKKEKEEEMNLEKEIRKNPREAFLTLESLIDEKYAEEKKELEALLNQIKDFYETKELSPRLENGIIELQKSIGFEDFELIETIIVLIEKATLRRLNSLTSEDIIEKYFK